MDTYIMLVELFYSKCNNNNLFSLFHTNVKRFRVPKEPVLLNKKHE